MDLGLKILSGPRTGEKFRLQMGLTIGRKKAQITIDDPRVSSLHATISQDEMGRWFILDNNSSNGLKINDVVVRQAYLFPGLKFQIGESVFKVVEVAAGAASGATVPPVPKQAEESWSDFLLNFFETASARFKDKMNPLQPLTPSLQLRFLNGPQADTQWLIGYGPRQVGANSLDLPVWETDAPDVCFEICPTDQGPEIRSDHPDKISINGKPLTRKVVTEGDRVDISGTTIEIRFHREANS